MDNNSFGSIETILPHRGTMLLLDGVSACTDETLTAYASVRADAWYADADGAMPAWIGIELMAQAIAAHVALLAMRAGGQARPGVLLGSRRYEAHIPAYARGARLRIEVKELLRGDEGHGAYECSIHHDQKHDQKHDQSHDQNRSSVCCAEAVIKVYQPADFQSFIAGSFGS